MGIKVTGVESVRSRLADIERFLQSPEPMRGIVNDVKDGILEKTKAGHDYMGKNFKPLSKAYAKLKGKRRADLNDTGKMLDAIKAEVITPKHGKVYIAGDRAIIAQFHNQGGPRTGRPPVREFMNLSKTGLQKIRKKRIDDPLLELAKRVRR